MESPLRIASGTNPRYATCHERTCTRAIAGASSRVADRTVVIHIAFVADLPPAERFLAVEVAADAVDERLPFAWAGDVARTRLELVQVGLDAGV